MSHLYGLVMKLRELRNRSKEIKTLTQFSEELEKINIRPDLREQILRTCKSLSSRPTDLSEDISQFVAEILDETIENLDGLA